MLQYLYCQSSDVCKDVLGIHTIVIYLTGIKIVLLDSWKIISVIFRSRILRYMQSVYCKHNLETD